MHYFQFNIGDYASHTRHLSLLEDLAYRRMLDTYYLTEYPLPESAAEVARLIGMRDQISEVEQVLTDFFTLTDDGWSHDRADAEILHFREKSIKASNAGKASAKRRSNRRSTSDEQTLNQPITNNQEPITKDKINCASSDAPPHADLLENEAETSNSETVSIADIVEYWNEVADRIGKPRVQRLSDSRKQVIKARIKQNSIDDFVTVFRNIEQSDFLRNWKAMGFDWVFKAANFQKILEGNYN
jgi:uncharacterized protein YdaU (DUF1376 family)